jgi:uncharacterized phiE125 gp8 family phage protein
MGSRVLGESILVARYPFDSSDPVWPVTVADLKLHTQIDHAEDDLLLLYGNGGYLAAATEYIEARGQVSLVHQRRKLRLDELPAGESVHVIRGPLVSVQSVAYLDSAKASQTLDAVNYRVITGGRSSAVYFDDDADVTLASGPGVVEINMTCGFGSLPDQVPALWRLLVAEVAAYFYERRNAIAGGGLDPAFEAVIDRKVTIAGGVKRYV